MLKPEEIWNIFQKSEALLEGHFKLTSGKHSNRYIQCAKVLQYPDSTKALCAEISRRLEVDKIEVVVGPATGGIIIAYEIARQLGVKTMFTERENGRMSLRRGFSIEKGQKVLVVEDVVTTGGSVKETIEVLKNEGAQVTACASLVDRSSGKVDFGIPFVSLLALEVKAFEAEDCPLCAQGIPVVKPGSRQEV